MGPRGEKKGQELSRRTGPHSHLILPQATAMAAVAVTQSPILIHECERRGRRKRKGSKRVTHAAYAQSI